MTSVQNPVAGAYLPVGHVLQGRYGIRGEVGRGGYSVVYQAEDISLGTSVAVKLLVPPPAMAHIARERMRREVRAVRGLSHPNIVALYDFLEEGPWSFIIMELVDGEDLATRVARRGALDPVEAAQLGSQIADALSAAHARGVLHRDVKPHNILIDAEGNARLVDFGSARLDGLVTMTQTGGIVGTMAYTAPEVLAGNRADARSDVYALGKTMMFSLGGYLPDDAMSRSLHGYVPDAFHPKTERPDVPDWLDRVIARATASNAAKRFPTAQSLHEALVQQNEHGAPDASSWDGSECIICGALDPFNLNLCVECSGSASDADTLVFLSLAKKSGHDALRGPGSLVFGRGHSRSEIEDALSGERALVRVPPAAADHIVRVLSKRGLPSFATKMSRVGRMLPRRFYGLLLAVIGVGWVTAIVVDIRLLIASPAIAFLLWLLAVRVAGRPLIETPRSRSNLLPDTETRIVDTLSSLPAGAAKDLLAELVRAANRSYRRVMGAGYSEHVGGAMVDLVESACAVAVDLAECDDQLRAQARRQFWGQDAQDLAEFTRLECMRDQLAQKFLEATAVVTRIRNDAWDAGSTSAVLQETTDALKMHVDAMAEVDRLLA